MMKLLNLFLILAVSWLSTFSQADEQGDTSVSSSRILSDSLQAGSMVYDSASNRVFLTGTISGSSSPSSSCMIASLSLPRLQWEQEATFTSSPEACQSLAKLNQDVLVGSTTGRLMISGDHIEFVDGQSLMSSSEKNGVPVSVVADSASSAVYVVSIENHHDNQHDSEVASGGNNSNNETSTATATTTTNSSQNEWMPLAMKIEKYGSMGKQDDPSSVLTAEWSNHLATFATDETKAGHPTVHVAGTLVTDKKTLVVAGSMHDGGDEYGFLSILDSTTGFVKAGGLHKEIQKYENSANDIVSGACKDPKDTNSIYIVGSNALQAFIKKIDLTTQKETWSVIFGAQTQANTAGKAQSLGCQAAKDIVYVAGVVENGADVTEGKSRKKASHGGDDIFVAQIERRYGAIKWVEQLGSKRDEHLARNNGILVDSKGNAIVFGDTTGCMFEEEKELMFENQGDQASVNADVTSSSSDLFVMVLDRRDGSYLATTEKSFDLTHIIPVPTAEKSFSSILDLMIWKYVMVVALALSLCFMHRRRVVCSPFDEERKNYEASNIFEYLQAFDVDDVNPKKSPLGGWNVVFKNDLAAGNSLNLSFRGDSYENQRKQIVSDYLFMPSPVKSDKFDSSFRKLFSEDTLDVLQAESSFSIAAGLRGDSSEEEDDDLEEQGYAFRSAPKVELLDADGDSDDKSEGSTTYEEWKLRQNILLK